MPCRRREVFTSFWGISVQTPKHMSHQSGVSQPSGRSCEPSSPEPRLWKTAFTHIHIPHFSGLRLSDFGSDGTVAESHELKACAFSARKRPSKQTRRHFSFTRIAVACHPHLMLVKAGSEASRLVGNPFCRPAGQHHALCRGWGWPPQSERATSPKPSRLVPGLKWESLPSTACAVPGEITLFRSCSSCLALRCCSTYRLLYSNLISEQIRNNVVRKIVHGNCMMRSVPISATSVSACSHFLAGLVRLIHAPYHRVIVPSIHKRCVFALCFAQALSEDCARDHAEPKCQLRICRYSTTAHRSPSNCHSQD